MVKTIYFMTDADGILEELSSTPTGRSGEESLDVPDGHEILKNPYIFRIVNGEPVRDDEWQEQLIKGWENKPPSAEEQLKAENKALSDRVDFLESVLEEMIFSIYQ